MRNFRRYPSGAVRSTPADVAAWGAPSRPATGSGPGSPGAGPAQADVPKVQFPPTYIPPAGSYNFTASQRQVFGPGPTAFVAFAGPQGQVRLAQGMVGVITSYTLTINNLLLTSDIAFSIRENNNPITGFGNVLVPQAGLAVAVLSSPPDMRIKISAGALIQFFVAVTDAVAYSMSVEVTGWQYNKVLDDQWRGVV